MRDEEDQLDIILVEGITIKKSIKRSLDEFTAFVSEFANERGMNTYYKWATKLSKILQEEFHQKSLFTISRLSGISRFEMRDLLENKLQALGWRGCRNAILKYEELGIGLCLYYIREF
jgi:hypothetical protein